MLKNYLITAFRTFKRNPFYSMINVSGLVIGITSCLLILLFVKHEFSYDQFHGRKHNIYRINYDITMGGNQSISPSVPDFVAPHLKRMFPEVEEAARYLEAFSPRSLRYNEQVFDESRFAWADSNFFKVFDFAAIRGNPAEALARPNTLVITESMVSKYFGEEDPIGKSMVWNNSQSYEVTAVIRDVPSTSSFTFDFLASMSSRSDVSETVSWNNPNYMTFLMLHDGTDVPSLQQKINDWVNPPDQPKATDNTLVLPLEPLLAIHFNTKVFNFGGRLAVIDPGYLYIFLTIGVAILLIACINYVNLATARASTRAKEVGLRRTVGAKFNQLLVQYLGESFLLMAPAVLLSLTLVRVLLPFIHLVTGKPLDMDTLNPEFLLYVLLGWILLSILAGLYPAFVLTNYKTVSVLKGVVPSSTGFPIRKMLVTGQFFLSIILIIGTVIVLNQLTFLQTKNLGMDKGSVILIRGNADLTPKLEAFANSLRALPGVVAVARTWRSPFETVVGNGFNLSPKPASEGWVVVGGLSADEDFIKTMGIQLLAGRNFEPAAMKDTVNEFIVNEKFLADFGLTIDEAVGRKTTLGMVMQHGPGTIVGVIRDFHFQSLHHPVQPLVMFNHPSYLASTVVRLAPGEGQRVIKEMENIWKDFVPQRPFNFTFLDDQYHALYKNEQRIATLVTIFSGLAIFIACMGLVGLSSFTILQRAKEISIRKVLGAAPIGIAIMLSTVYARIMLVSFLLACPVGYYLLSGWLENFAYRIEINAFYFVLTAGVTMMLIVSTIGLQSYRASVANPANGLRSE